MAEIVLDDVTKRYPDGFEAVKDMNLDDRRRRVHDPRRPVGLREVDGAADDRRARGHHRRRAADRRRGRQRPRAQGPRHRDGLPELRALPAHDRAREHGLRAQAAPRSTRRRSTRRSRRRREILDLDEHLDRKPANLSGGQRQRVAMGRAIVRDPKAFLMDEPLSNLDAKLRVQMRTEVSRIQQRLGTTTVYVTHDQTEAMTLGDRVAVMRARRAPAGRLADGALRRPGEPVRRRLHRLAGDELPAGARSRATSSKLPIGDVRCRRACASALGARDGRRRDRRHPARGLRGRRAGRRRSATAASTFKAKIDVVESMGSELYAHFARRGRAASSPRSSQELAEDAGAAEVPSAGEAARSSPGSTPASKAAEGEEAELWLDASKLHLSTPATATRLRRRTRPASSAAVGRGPRRSTRACAAGGSASRRRACRRRSRSRRADAGPASRSSSTTGTYSSSNHARATSRAVHEARGAPASRGSPRPRRPRPATP